MTRKSLRLVTLIALVLILSTVLGIPSLAMAAARTLLINGVRSSIQPKLVNGVWMVPLEAYTRALNGSVSYTASGSTYSVSTTPSAADTWQKAKAYCVGLVVTKVEPDEFGVTQYSQVSGSGVVISSDGYIVTNEHVISSAGSDASSIEVLLHDGTVLPGKVVGSDYLTDLALVKVGASSLTSAPLAEDASVRVGQRALVIGSPLGQRFQNSLSVGVVSGLGRDLGNEVPFIQLDAPISPGNSGGAVLDETGKLIGIATSKLVSAGVEGVGFAVPTGLMSRIVKSLKLNGKFDHAWLGLFVDEGWNYRGLPSRNGLEITGIVKGGPCDKAGVLPGDRLMSIEGVKLGTQGDLAKVLFEKRPGDIINIGVGRGGVLIPAVSLQVTLGTRPSESEVAAMSSVYEATLQVLTAKYQQSTVYGRNLRFSFSYLHDMPKLTPTNLYIKIDRRSLSDFWNVLSIDPCALEAWLTSVARDAQASLSCQKLQAVVWFDDIFIDIVPGMRLEDLTPYLDGWRYQVPLIGVTVDGTVARFEVYTRFLGD